jgi:hypothetical protein
LDFNQRAHRIVQEATEEKPPKEGQRADERQPRGQVLPPNADPK